MSFLKNLLGNGDAVSSKRFVGLVSSMSLCVTMVANSFTDLNVAPSDTLVDGVLWLALGSLGFTSLDKFAGTKKKDAE
jgi:hypothetical protein